MFLLVTNLDIVRIVREMSGLNLNVVISVNRTNPRKGPNTLNIVYQMVNDSYLSSFLSIVCYIITDDILCFSPEETATDGSTCCTHPLT